MAAADVESAPRSVALARGLRIGRIFGVEIRADAGLLIVFMLVWLGLATGQLPRWHPSWSALLCFGVGLGAAALFFASILLHELSHAVVARAYGVPVRGITLFMLGGVAQIEGEPPHPRAELLMAAVGPVTSLAVGVLATVAGGVLAAPHLAAFAAEPGAAMSRVGPFATLLLWLGPVNVVLGLFNLVPGFPLDGGRVLRALLWWATGDVRRATRWASMSGRWIAVAIITLGVLAVLGFGAPVVGLSSAVQGLWLVLIGWFLYNAARSSYEQLLAREALEHVQVASLMLSRLDALAPTTTVAELVRDRILHGEQRCFPVLDEDRFVGLVCLEDVRSVREQDWERVPVSAIMTPVAKLTTLSPRDEALRALEELARRDIDQLPVVEGEHLLGLFRRRDVVKWLGLQHERAAA